MNRVEKYAIDVLEGKEVTGELVKLACKRHFYDLERQGTNEFPFIFDEAKALENIRFFECLKFTDGDMMGKAVELFPFQDFIIGSLFGWVNKHTYYRRYRKSYVQLARKNAKSLINSGLAIKFSGFDKYPNAQVYCTATKMKQARIVWEQAEKFILVEPDLKALFKIKEHDAIIESTFNGGKIMALGRDTGTIDGFDPHCGIIDEYHSHKTSQMIKLLEDGSVNQKQSLISIITTAGFDLNYPCYAEYEYCKKVLQLLEQNIADQYFIYIAQMDKEDDIWNPDNWIKANPLVSKIPHAFENLKRFAKESKEKGGEDLRNLMTKSFNIWVQFSDDDYINIENWKKCACKLTLEDMRDKECIVGLDLSSGGDLTSLSLEFPIIEDNKKKYFIHSHSFIPKNRLMEHVKTDKAPYDIWLKESLLTVTETLDGVKTDYKYIIKYLKDLQEKYNLKFKTIAYDPHNADAFLSDLESFGCDCISIIQSARNLNDPTVDFQLEVDAGNILYNEINGLLTWSFCNAKLTFNSFGECKIDKNYRIKRIDPCDATVNCHKIAMTKTLDLSSHINSEKWSL